ncbi:MAG TPA: fibronectin type III domain-containing protein [Nocardioidaceae bacterium]|nr:fibronectin type III domain-containing protein [Nocardioidaceae bacterium]
MAATNNVVADWELNEGTTATTAVDSSGNGIDGAIDPTAASHGLHTGVMEGGNTFYRWDNRCPACEPAEVQRVVTIPDDDRLDITDASMTWSLEFRFRTGRPFGNFMQKGQSASRGGQIKVQAPNGIVQCLFKGEDGTRVGTGSPDPLNDNQWHTVECIRTETQVKEFVDGVRVAVKNGATGIINNKKPFTIGGKTECDQITITCDYFVGDIDYVKVSNDAGTTGNVPPVAMFAPTCPDLTCSFNSAGTTDPDGSISSYDWDFGDGSLHSSATNPMHTYTDPGTYSVTLTVTDNLGSTDKAVHAVTVSNGAPPSKPRNPLATAGDRSATVEWSTPSSPGAQPITGYVATSNPGGKTCTAIASGRSCVVNGLTNGTAYTFTIIASSDAGDSPSSNPTSAVTPAGAPLAPPTAHAKAGNHRATVSWSAANPNGSAITGYVVKTLPGGHKTTVGAGATSVVIKGLKNGTAYHFTVAARNAVGTGAAKQTNTVHPAGYPLKVGKVHATGGHHSATVTWAPANGNGAKVLNYRIVSSNGRSLVVKGSAHRVEFKNLKAGSKVRFRVLAINRLGAGPWSNWTPRVTIK